MTFKICSKCRKKKPLNEFHKNKTRKDGRDTWCSMCSNEYNLKYYRDNIKIKRKKSKERSAKHRKKAKTCAITFFNLRAGKYKGELTGQYLLNIYTKSPFCYYCGKPFKSHCDIQVEHKIPVCRGGKSDNSNVVLSCKGCNMLKGILTDIEFKGALKDFIKTAFKNLDLDDRGEP